MAPAPTPRDFVCAVVNTACKHGGADYLELRLIHPNGTTNQIWLTNQEALDNWPKVAAHLASLNQKGFNIYYGPNKRTSKSGTAADICPYRYVLWADIDYKDKALLANNTAPLKSFGITPSIVVSTGNGYHFYWLLEEAITPAEAEQIMRQLARVLAGDHVYDGPRILRLPGTLNVKDPANPKPCTIARWHPDKLYNETSFDPLANCAAGTPPPGKKALAPPPGKKTPAPTPARPRQTVPTPLVYGNGHGFMTFMSRAITPFWDAGKHHNLAVGLAGLLRKDDVPQPVAEEIIAKITAITEDHEAEDRQKAVRSTYKADINKISASQAIITTLGESRAKALFKAYNNVIKNLPPPPLTRPKLPEFDLYECVPPGSIFEKYVAYAYEKTDAPIQYHAASIVTVVAAALGNRVCIPDFFGGKLFPNLYTLLTGPSSRYRKSTSIRLAKKIAAAAKITTYPNNATIEAMYTKLAPNECEWKEEEIKSGPRKGEIKRTPVAWEGKPQGIIYHYEFANYLQSSGKSYMQGHRDFLTDLYDGIADKETNSKETKTQGKYYITDPAISMLCAVTPASMRDFVTKIDMKGGFLSRFFVTMYPDEHQNRFGWRRKRKEDLDAAYEIANFIAPLTEATGEMDLSPGAEKLWVDFDKWIHKRIAEVEGTPAAMLDSFLTRLTVMAVKLSMIYAWGQHKPATTIEIEDMMPAIGFCKYSANALAFFFEAIRPEEGNRDMRYQRQVIEAARGITRRYNTQSIPHRLLLQNSNLTADQFRQAIGSLTEEGRFTKSLTPNGRSMEYLLNEK